MSDSDPIAAELRRRLKIESSQRFIIAYSGGVDSHVLLHVLANLVHDRDRLKVVHIDHELHEDSGNWALHCGRVADSLGLTAEVIKITRRPRKGDSIESWARKQRYQLFESIIDGTDAVLTAHHQEDLAETFLLQLFRGAGPHGLSSIAAEQSFGTGTIVRPLLNVSRSEIHEYAINHKLDWVEDSSNAADKFERNFLRHQLMPLVKEKWPAVTERIAHAVTLQRESAALLDITADSILVSAINDSGRQVALATLLALDETRRRWALRRWIVRAGFPIPDAVHLRAMLELLDARVDAQPCVKWKGAEMRRYRGTVYLGSARPRELDITDYQWDLCAPLELPSGILSASKVIGGGLRTRAVGAGVRVRFRRGGERCRPSGRAHSQTLKHFFQQWGIVPWLRAEIPLLYIGDEIAAVADICACQPFAAGAEDDGWALTWSAFDAEEITS